MPRRRDSKIDVSVTLTDEEWFAVVLRLTFGGQPRSPKGIKLCDGAIAKIQSQICAGLATASAGKAVADVEVRGSGQ